MKKFIIKTIVLSLTFIGIIFLLISMSSFLVKSRGFSNYTDESNTLFLEDNKQYDLLFMGISHARNFSRHKNHLRLEKILNSKIVNIAQGDGACGVNEQLFYLDYFFYKGNSASKIIYILSPPMLFSETLPIASNTFKNEAFDIPFISRYAGFESENKSERIISYLQQKLNPSWFLKKPETLDSMVVALDSLDKEAVIKGQNRAYSGPGLNEGQFKKAVMIVEETIKFSRKKNSEVILIIPPALFGKWRGHEETSNFAQKMELKYPNVSFFDASETMFNPNFYYDNHHLNTKGVNYFVENYLKQLLK